jgi:DNA polymerase-3 subunit delta
MKLQTILPLLKNNLINTHKAILLYGNDPMVMQFNLDLMRGLLKAQGYKLNTVERVGDLSLGKEPDLFGLPTDKEVSICLKVTGTDFKELEAQIAGLTSDHILICLAPGINTKTKLVQYFQTGKDVIALACYDLAPAVLKQVIEAELSKRTLQLPPAQVELLVETYRGAPVSLVTDMDKIALYLFDRPDLTDQELKLLINGALQLGLDELIKSYLLRDRQSFLKAADITLLQEEPYLILRSLIRQLMQFCEYLAQLQITAHAAQAFAALSAPLFFTMRPIFEQAGPKWCLREAAQALTALRETELDYKKGNLSPAQFQRALLP